MTEGLPGFGTAVVNERLTKPSAVYYKPNKLVNEIEHKTTSLQLHVVYDEYLRICMWVCSFAHTKTIESHSFTVYSFFIDKTG